MAIKTFTTGEVLTASDTNTYLANAGLVYITAADLTGVTNSFSNVFSSTYNAYRIVVTGLNNATGTVRSMSLRFRTTSDDTSNNYAWGQTFVYGAGTFGSSGAAPATSALLGELSNLSPAPGSLVLDIMSPNQAQGTTYCGSLITYQSNVGSIVFRNVLGHMNTSTQYTGFSLIGTTDNLSGNCTVYGYRIA